MRCSECQHIEYCPQKAEESDLIGCTAQTPLKPCPFCGKEATIETVVRTRGNNTTGNIPEGARLVEIKKNVVNRMVEGEIVSIDRYYWERDGYTPHCLTPKCICRTVMQSYETKTDAVKAWNERI